jgi:NAD(P)-dependent dehydrogenase (short-subunit alcohol dehydrogenase family)
MPTVLITGANRGIGLEFARQYAANGWRVHACCRHPAKAAELKRLADASDGRLGIHALEVTDHGAIDALARALKKESLDLLINNAGTYGPNAQSIAKMDYAGWAETMAVNVMAPMRMAQAFLPHLAKGERPRVVVVTSTMGSIADNGSGGDYAYRSSKAAVNMVVRSLAVDMRGQGIVAVAVHPGWVRTRMGGPGAPLSPEQSVAAMRRLIDGLTMADSGGFRRYDGGVAPW